MIATIAEKKKFSNHMETTLQRSQRQRSLDRTFYISAIVVAAIAGEWFHMIAAIPGGGTWVFFGWVCAARESKLAPRSKKKNPLELIPRSRNRPIFYTPF